MKTLILMLMLLIAAPAISHADNPKSKKMGTANYLPFARSGKYGKLPTKKARLVKFRIAWRHKQWGR